MHELRDENAPEVVTLL